MAIADAPCRVSCAPRLWLASHSLILKCDACHSAPDFSVSIVSSAEYELATLLYLYSLRVRMIAHVTTRIYQREFAKAEAAVSDSMIRHRTAFRGIGNTIRVVKGAKDFGALQSPLVASGRMFATVMLLKLVNSVSGTPYITGGDSPRGTDCSGLVSWVSNAATGRPICGDRFNTGNIEKALLARGFQYGSQPGALNVGWNGGHTAATLPDGTPVSAGEGVGCGSVAVALSRGSSATTCSFRCQRRRHRPRPIR